MTYKSCAFVILNYRSSEADSLPEIDDGERGSMTMGDLGGEGSSAKSNAKSGDPRGIEGTGSPSSSASY